MIAPVLAWRMWWGGQCPPARFLVPLVPLLAVAAAVGLPAGRPGLFRWRWPLSALGLALVLYMAADPGRLLMLNRGDRQTRVWTTLSADVNVGDSLPSLVAGESDDVRVTLVWIAVLAALLTAHAASQRTERADRLFRSLGLPLLLLVLAEVPIDRWARQEGAAPGPGASQR